MMQRNAWLVSVALGMMLASGCGLVDEPRSVTHDAGAPRTVEDASADAAAPTDAAFADDGGEKLSPCEKNKGCPELPVSVCLDDSTLRWYSSSCEDGCQLHATDMKCPSSPKPDLPDCFRGGCQAVVVR